MIYLALPSAEMAKLRVAERVSHGGYDIPVPDIERRFLRSLENLFEDYVLQVNRTVCFLNSGETPEIVFTQQGEHREVKQPADLQTAETVVARLRLCNARNANYLLDVPPDPEGLISGPQLQRLREIGALLRSTGASKSDKG